MRLIGATARDWRRRWRAAKILLHVVVGRLIAWLVLPAPLAGCCAHRRHGVIQAWSRRLNALLDLRVQVHGTAGEGPTLYVANHISWLDIPCLSATLDTYFLAKHEVAAWPLIGAMAKRAGAVFIRRGDAASLALALDRMTRLLRCGHSVVLFPEGTTSTGTGVRRFHSRLYRAALRAGAAIQPIAIAYPHAGGVHPAAPFVGDDDLAHHLWALLAAPRVDAVVTFCPPIAIADGDSCRLLADRSRARIVAALSGETVHTEEGDRRAATG